MNIRIAGTVKESIVDGPGIRYTIFTQGCPHHCHGCHNPQTHDPQKGFDQDIDKLVEEIIRNPLLDGITLSGGEPLLQIDACLELITKLEPQQYDIVLYTGYTWEQLTVMMKEDTTLASLLEKIDYLIDGKYDEGLRDIGLLFRGSKNQRIIQCKQSIMNNQILQLETI